MNKVVFIIFKKHPVKSKMSNCFVDVQTNIVVQGQRIFSHRFLGLFICYLLSEQSAKKTLFIFTRNFKLLNMLLLHYLSTQKSCKKYQLIATLEHSMYISCNVSCL